MRLFREWGRINEFANSQTDDEAFDKALDERWEVEKRLIQTPSQNERDVLVKIIAWTCYGDGDLEAGNPISQPIWAEARALIGGASAAANPPCASPRGRNAPPRSSPASMSGSAITVPAHPLNRP